MCMAVQDGLREDAGVCRYKFGGKELNTDFGLKLNDFGARWYDPAVGRFASVDPLTESMSSWSPYNYTFNNPLRFADLTGMAPTDWPPRLSWNSLKGAAVSAVQSTVAFTAGVANGFGSSMLLNAGRGDAAADFPNNAAAASNGQMVGDAAAVVVGAVETVLGAVATAGGGTATVATGGAASPVSLPVAAGGLAATAHGASAVTTGMQNLMATKDRSGMDFTRKGKQEVISDNKAQNQGQSVC